MSGPLAAWLPRERWAGRPSGEGGYGPMKWGSMTRQAQGHSGQGGRRGPSTLDQLTASESRWEVVEPVVWRHTGVMEFFSPQRTPSKLNRRPWFNSWVRKICWRRDRLPTPVFWPGEFHGLYSPWGHKESDTTERLSLFTFKGYPGGASGKEPVCQCRRCGRSVCSLG